MTHEEVKAYLQQIYDLGFNDGNLANFYKQYPDFEIYVSWYYLNDRISHDVFMIDIEDDLYHEHGKRIKEHADFEWLKTFDGLFWSAEWEENKELLTQHKFRDKILRILDKDDIAYEIDDDEVAPYYIEGRTPEYVADIIKSRLND